MNIATSYL